MTALREQISAIEDDVARGKHTAMSLFTLMRQFIKIDAEGDGAAAWWTTKDCAEPITSEKKSHMISLGYPADNAASWYNVPLYTHPQPARSGVVSDEQVREALMAASKKSKGTGLSLTNAATLFLSKKAEAPMRAALEHFAKSQGKSDPTSEIFPGTHADLSALSIQPKDNQS